MVKSSFVEAKNAEFPKPSMGFFISLWKGLDALNTFPVLVLIPILLDGFLWFGPHFSMAPWFIAHKELLQTNTFAGNTATGLAEMDQFIQQFNLASALSAWGLFPPSLMAANGPINNPVGLPITIPLTSTLSVLELFFAFLLFSLPLGAFYWALAGLTAEPAARSWRGLLGGWGRVLALLFFFAIIVTLGVFFIGLPLIFIAGLLSFVSSALSLILAGFSLLGSWVVLWIILLMAFAPHDAVLFPVNPVRAILHSMESVRVQYPSAMVPLMLWGGLLWVTHFIWSLPPTNDWLGVIGVAGSAYTSSWIVTSSLVYYKDRRRWLEETKAFLAAKRVEQPAASPTTRG